MTSLKNVLCVISEFLNEAQKLGIIKEFEFSRKENDSENISGADELLSAFVQKIKDISAPEKSVKLEIENKENPEDTPGEAPMKLDLVQIQIETNEMKRRIAAFAERKRKEIDEWNVKEFCGNAYVDENDPAWEHQDSCARINAIYIPRRGSKSHIKVSKVENNYGPQTQVKKIKTEVDSDENAVAEVIEERLQIMESHLKLETDSSLRSNIFQRLKNLEDRILYLEGLSPEYMHGLSSDYSSQKKKNVSEKEKLYSNWSIPDLNKRIESLKEHLKKK